MDMSARFGIDAGRFVTTSWRLRSRTCRVICCHVSPCELIIPPSGASSYERVIVAPDMWYEINCAIGPDRPLALSMPWPALGEARAEAQSWSMSTISRTVR